MATFDDDRDLPGPAGLCRLATELIDQALQRVPVLDTHAVSSAPEAIVAVDRTLARWRLSLALEQLRCADALLLPYVAVEPPQHAAPGSLVVISGGVDQGDGDRD